MATLGCVKLSVKVNLKSLKGFKRLAYRREGRQGLREKTVKDSMLGRWTGSRAAEESLRLSCCRDMRA